MTMTSEQMVAEFQSYLAHHDGYIPGTSGELWTETKQDKKSASDSIIAKYGSQWIGHHVEDCSGAVVRACRKYGYRIYHGSNRIAREYVVKLLPPSEARPGMVAFKSRKPGEKYYDLKDEYKPGNSHYNGDLNDYYHIGCVDSNPAYVINAQSTQTGVVRSKIANGWDCVGWLKFIEKEKEPMDAQTMVVTTDKVNLRAAPDKDSQRIEWLNKGDVVTVRMAYDNGWDFVAHGTKQGYVMARFLEASEDIPVVPPNAPSEATDIEDKEALGQWVLKALTANAEEREALIEIANRIGVAAG
jgi:hypothetical protein